ncbi:hypothetical protein ACIQPR_48035 [Streptomyces sp. NPDC091280]|uniref:LexA family protein n=1 Tax=Streptomyces sp. NPDC091280 TaxID=3365984 RepID=UPI00381355EF
MADHGEGPSVRQIADDIGFSSTSSVAYHLGNLQSSAASWSATGTAGAPAAWCGDQGRMDR